MSGRSLTSPLARAAEGTNNGAGGSAADDVDDTADGDESEAADDDGEITAEKLDAARKDAAEARAETKRVNAHRERIRSERSKLAGALKRWNGLGDPDEIEARLAEREHEDEEDAKKTGDTDKLLTQRDDKYRRDMGQRDETITDLRGRIERLTINQRLRTALDEVKVDSDLMDGAFALLRPKMKLVEDEDGDDGYRVVARVDDDEMSIDDYVKSLAETDLKFQRYLVTPVNAGGGAQPGRRGDAGGIVRKARSDMSIAEKSAYIDKYGQEKYEALPMMRARTS